MTSTLKRFGTALGIVALTIVTWLGLNYVKSAYVEYQTTKQALSAVIGVINYNVEQGKLVIPKGK